MVNVLRNIVLKVTPKPATGSKNPIRSHSSPWSAVHLAFDPTPDPDHPQDLGKLRQHLARHRRDRITAGEGVEFTHLFTGRLSLRRLLLAAEEGEANQHDKDHCGTQPEAP